MKNKFIRITAIAFILMMLLGATPVFAANSYKTYTYSKDAFPMDSPDAYTPVRIVDYKAMGISKAIKDPADIETDEDGNVYIADAGNNRILVLDRYYKYKRSLSSFTNGNGIPDSLTNPNGVFVNSKYIYVADTDNKRIVIFNRETGKFDHLIEEPQADVFPADSVYRPIAVAADEAGTMYVVSSSTYMGVIALKPDGNFQSFIGAQKVTISAWDRIWRFFQTDEQRAQSDQYISTEFNNITIDSRGFIYVTTSSIDPNSQQAAVTSRGSDYSPVKKLNVQGDDIMKRTGFFGFGEVNVQKFSTDAAVPVGASKIVDVALGPENTWSIIDEKRSKIYTYDEYGNLLFIFGDKGIQLGNITTAKAIAYQGDDMLVLDSAKAAFTVYSRTEYGDILIGALKNQNDRKYDKAKEDWENILQRNNNFDSAYVGIGKALYREGKWSESLTYFKAAYNTEDYSAAFKMERKEWVSKYIYVIPIVIIVVVIAVVKFFSYAAKVNKKVAVSTEKRTLWQEILFAFHLIFHPFDGFWDLKHEKRGSLRAALIIDAAVILTFTYQSAGTAYVFNPSQTYPSILAQIISVVVPLMLWVTSNWCFTTLFEGEGGYKDIFIATSYCLVPIILLFIPATLLTHVLTSTEGAVVSLLQSFAWIWAALLLFVATMVTHDYSLGKNLLTIIVTVAGMAIIMFIMLLFTHMLTNVISFITQLVTEISYR